MNNSDNDNLNTPITQANKLHHQTQPTTPDIPQQLPQGNNEYKISKPTNPVTELAKLILDKTQPWQVHNCKLISQNCDQQGTLPFLYHYDRLPKYLKQEHPLTGSLLAKFNTPMSANQACQLLGIDTNIIEQPWFVKITGSVVIYLDSIQLALRLHWSNTNKQFDSIYCQEQQQAINLAMEGWQLLGRVDTIYKKSHPQLAVLDEQATEVEQEQYILPNEDGYQAMPANFSFHLLQELNDNQNQLDWLSNAIKQRIE